MEFKQYPSYKNSGVEWLGDVPDEWDIYPFWHLFNRKEITNKTQEQLLSVYLDRGVILHSEGGGMVHKPADNLEKYQLVEVNDFVMNNQQAWRGSVGVSPYKGIVSPAYLIFSFNKKICAPKFFKYFLRDKGVVDQFMIASMSVGTIQRQVKWHLLKTIQLSIPSLIEQNTIANFLDTETARIDNLISKQEKLIELLEEQRKSIISHAVTKGLNPNAPMKDSGVEWLGKVPNDWNLSRLDAVSKIVRGNSAFSKMDLLESGKYVALQYGKTYKVNEINESFGSYVNQEFFKKSQITEFGDIILISTSETLEDLGHSCFYARHDVGLIGGEQFLLKPKNQNFGKYIYYATKAFSSYLQRYATGLKVFRFNLDDLKKIYIPDISLVEQQKIAEFLDKETARIDISVLKQKSLIEKLKEYRASIISHAVTGKIDVREFGA